MAETVLIYKAIARNVRMSPRKARLSVDLIRGKRVEEALDLLEFDNRRASYAVRKVLLSAVANAGHLAGLDPMDLVVREAQASKGLTMKRWRPEARGRIGKINKFCSHITIIVGQPAA